MQKTHILLITLILAVVGIQAVSGYNISRDIGESYIKWTWDTDTDQPIMIIIDGEQAMYGNSTLGYYYLTEIGPNEEHRIDILNASDPYSDERAHDVARTLPSTLFVCVLLIFVFALLIITISTINAGQDWLSLLTAVSGITISNYGRALSYGSWGLAGLFWTFIIFLIILLIIALCNLLRESIRWK